MAIDHFGELLVRPQALPLQTLPPVLEEAAGPALALVAPDEPNDACERITKHTEQWFLRTEARKPVRVQQTRSLRRSRHPKIMPDFEGPTKSRKPSNSAASRQVVPLKSLTRFREDPNFIPVVPPKSNRISAWEYDREMYKRRNEIERQFRRLKGFRRIFSRFEKLDLMFIAFIHFHLIVEALRQC